MRREERRFWERAQRVMQERELTIAELGRLSRVDQRTIAKGMVDHAVPRADNAMRIADALGVSIRYLLEGTRDRKFHDEALLQSLVEIGDDRKACALVRTLPLLSNHQTELLKEIVDTWKARGLLEPKGA